jgi:histidyl-tRNA synthetase
VLLATILERLGVAGVRLRLSSLGSPDTRAAYREDLGAYLRSHIDALAPVVRERIELNPLRAFDSDDPGTREVMAGAPRLLDRLDADDAAHFAEVRELLDRAEVAHEIDATLVRGLDYYTRTLFEFTSDALGAQSGVAGGGRYDGLIEQLGGPPTPGIGWAAGIERILMASPERPAAAPALDLYVAFEHARADAFAVLADARAAGLAAQMELAGRSLKGQLKQAERLGARFVAVVEGDSVRLRDLRASTEETLPRAAVVARLVAA